MAVDRAGTGFKPLTEREKWLTGEIVGIAIGIHKAIGPGLLGNVYERCFCYELEKRNIPFAQKKWMNIIYGAMVLEQALRIDILVDNLIIIEIRAQATPDPIWAVQLLSYLKITGKRLGYVINFHVPLMKDGIKRMIV